MKKKILFSAIVLFSLSSCGFFSNSTNSGLKPKPIENNTVIVNETSASAYSSMAELVADVKPTVVDVYSYGTNFTSAGSGVIIGSNQNDYYIITNHHVVDGAQSFTVVTYNEEDMSDSYEAILLGGSPKNDIAVLKISSQNVLKVATFASNSDTIKTGQEVIAIGNPLGILGGSVTHGIVSAKERTCYIQGIGYMSLLQTDAAINSGNSGGALFDYTGLLIGVVNSGYSDYQGLNFAIPSNKAKECFKSIVETYKSPTSLGYVLGESNVGLITDVATVYTDINRTHYEDVVYVKSVYGSDLSEKNIHDYNSFATGNYSTFYALRKINDIVINQQSTAELTIQNLVAGASVKFTFEEIGFVRKSSGFFVTNDYYLTGETVEITVEVSQYIYSIS